MARWLTNPAAKAAYGYAGKRLAAAAPTRAWVVKVISQGMLAYKRMAELPASIIITIVVLTVFLIFITALKYAITDNFVRTRLMMTAFFLFIVTTLTISYWEFFFATLPYTIPAGLVGVFAGWVVGVRTAEQKLRTAGVAHYM